VASRDGRCDCRGSRRCGGAHPRSPGCGIFCRFVGYCGSLGLSFGIGSVFEMFPDLFRHIKIERARMRLLFRKTQPGQVVQDRLRLDLEFPG